MARNELKMLAGPDLEGHDKATGQAQETDSRARSQDMCVRYPHSRLGVINRRWIPRRDRHSNDGPAGLMLLPIGQQLWEEPLYPVHFRITYTS